VTVVAHDWGSFVAFLFVTAHPSSVEAFVALDVGMVTPLKLGPFTALVIVGYQTWLALVFVLSQLFAGGGAPLSWLHRLANVAANVAMLLYPWQAVGPCPREWAQPRPASDARAWMCYPYLQVLLQIGRSLRLTGRPPPPPAFPPDLGVPVCYLFGAEKRALFHTVDFLEALDDCTAGRRIFAPLAEKPGHDKPNARAPGEKGEASGRAKAGNARAAAKRAMTAAARADVGSAAAPPVAAAAPVTAAATLVHLGSACRWRRVADAGHWLHCQRPEYVEQELREFMAAVAEAKAKATAAA
jgi:pimeloyl-ACP methyl ester carboxylesterase